MLLVYGSLLIWTSFADAKAKLLDDRATKREKVRARNVRVCHLKRDRRSIVVPPKSQMLSTKVNDIGAMKTV